MHSADEFRRRSPVHDPKYLRILNETIVDVEEPSLLLRVTVEAYCEEERSGTRYPMRPDERLRAMGYMLAHAVILAGVDEEHFLDAMAGWLDLLNVAVDPQPGRHRPWIHALAFAVSPVTETRRPEMSTHDGALLPVTGPRKSRARMR